MNKYIAIIIFSDDSILDNIAEISATFINEMIYESSVVVVFDSAFRLNEIKTYLTDSREERMFIISEYNNSAINLPEGAEEYLSSVHQVTDEEITYTFESNKELEKFKQTLTDIELDFFEKKSSFDLIGETIADEMSANYDSLSNEEKTEMLNNFVLEMTEQDKTETLETLEAKLPNLSNLEKDLMKFIINEQD